MIKKNPQVRATDRRRHPIRRTVAVVAPLAIVGIVAFMATRSGHDAAPGEDRATARAEPAGPTAASSAAVATPSLSPPSATPAQASGSAPAARAWQAAAQPAAVAAMRTDSLAAYQVQMDRWNCEGDSCVGNLRVPPTVEAGRTGDMSAAANVFNTVKDQMARHDIDVAVQSIHRAPDGLAIDLQFSPVAARHGRFYTDVEITAIRAESFEQGMKAGGAGAVH